MTYSHYPITLDKLSCVFIHKTCFEDFSTIIHPGDRIAILGPNGSGKSTLLKIIAGLQATTSGIIHGIRNTQVGYLKQLHNDEAEQKLSGGERVLLALEEMLALNPSLLLLDEPTNHLDAHNREKLLKLLEDWKGSGLIVTHDTELLRTWPTRLWYLSNGKIIEFNGSYDDFLEEQQWHKERSLSEIERLKKEQKRLAQREAQQQQKAAKSKRNAKNAMLKGSISRLAFNGMKEKAEATSGTLKRNLEQKRSVLAEQLSNIHIAEELAPTFQLPPLTHKNAALLVQEGTVSYGNKRILSDVYLNIQPGERYAIIGDNGSGKSSLFKAILNDPSTKRTGSWSCPPAKLIGYIDQHYSMLTSENTVFETIKDVQPDWDNQRIRKLLNDFLFRTPDEVSSKVGTLSGGERARLALACIVAQAPPMLLLDEITNNLDLIARQQIINSLVSYPGTLLVISHDNDFLKQLGITNKLVVSGGTIKQS